MTSPPVYDSSTICYLLSYQGETSRIQAIFDRSHHATSALKNECVSYRARDKCSSNVGDFPGHSPVTPSECGEHQSRITDRSKWNEVPINGERPRPGIPR